MTRVVESVVSQYTDSLTWKKIITKDLAGAQRYQNFSKSLGRPAPVPSIVIDGELVFETTPSAEELKDRIEEFIERSQR